MMQERTACWWWWEEAAAAASFSLSLSLPLCQLSLPTRSLALSRRRSVDSLRTMAGGGRKKTTGKVKADAPTSKKAKLEESDAEDSPAQAGDEVSVVESEKAANVQSSNDAAAPPAPEVAAEQAAPPTAPDVDDGGGRLLICGATNWDLIGRKELPKSAAKNAAQSNGRNLWGPHVLADLRVKEVVSSSCSCHSVAITTDGKVLTWGRNDKGQLGLGDLMTRSTPVQVKALDGLNVVTAACGKGHTLFLTDKGVVYSVGENKMGQLGHGNQGANVLVPQKVRKGH